MRPMLLVALKDLRLRLRDRSAIIVAFIAPFLLAAIMGFSFGGAQDTIHFTFAVADEDRGEITETFREGLGGLPEEAFTILDAADGDEARDLVAEDEAGAAFVLPEGMTASIQAGEPSQMKVIRGADSPISGEIAESIAQAFTAEVEATSLALQTAVRAGVAQRGVPLPQLIAEAAESRIPVGVTDGALSANEVSMISYVAPSMAIFFLFFTVQQAPLSILVERKDQTLQRMAAAPITGASIMAGKFLSAFLLGLISLAVLAATTSALLGASWGQPGAALALGAAVTFAAMGITALTSFGARSEESAGGLGSIVAVVLGLLGGSFFPLTQTPGVVRSLSMATPHGWAIRGFVDLIASGEGVEVISTNIVVLLAIGVVTFIAALALSRRLLRV